MTASEEIDGYLARLPAEQRVALQHLREDIMAAAPEAEEGFSYGAPAFRYRGRPLVAYAAAKSHCSFFPMSPPLIEAHAAELTDFDTAKGTIRFAPDRTLPESLVRAIVRQRIAEIDGVAGGRRG
jgi:uncharacterized protein YdhG (YjbR/CyaY superfamily)